MKTPDRDPALGIRLITDHPSDRVDAESRSNYAALINGAEHEKYIGATREYASRGLLALAEDLAQYRGVSARIDLVQLTSSWGEGPRIDFVYVRDGQVI